MGDRRGCPDQGVRVGLLGGLRGARDGGDGPDVRDRRGACVDLVRVHAEAIGLATGAVPAPVSEAFSQLVGHWYRQAKTFAEQEYQMLLERTSGTAGKVWSWSLASGLKLPPGVMELLAPYRVPVV